MKINPKLIVLFGLLAGLNSNVKAQTDATSKGTKYRRSSLHLILMEADDYPLKEVVVNAYHSAPFPDKYNNHNIGINSFDLKQYPLATSEKKEEPSKQSRFNIWKEKVKKGVTTAVTTVGGNSSNTNNSNSNNTTDDEESKNSNLPLKINKFIAAEHIASKLVAKWFDRQADGAFDMKLVGERGAYNASEMEAGIAKASVRGTASLEDAGEELISNTFVVFSRLKFLSNELPARAVLEAEKLRVKDWKPILRDPALKLAEATYEQSRQGYTVWTTSFLYKLHWNDSVASVFYHDYWMDKKTLNAARKAAFDNSNIFTMDLVGSAKSSSIVFLTTGRTQEQVVKLATIRNADNVFAKLQKEFEVFRPKVPLYSGDPITAKIGMKEGLTGGERFEVLEQTQNEKTGLTVYERRGVISVDKNSLWDNRYDAADEPADGAAKKGVDRTAFNGSNGKYYSGMLIRELK